MFAERREMRSLQKAGLLPKSMFSGHSDRPLSTGPTSLTFPDIQGVCRQGTANNILYFSLIGGGGIIISIIFILIQPFPLTKLKQRQRLSIETCIYDIYDVKFIKNNKDKCQANSKPSQILWAKIDKLSS